MRSATLGEGGQDRSVSLIGTCDVSYLDEPNRRPFIIGAMPTPIDPIDAHWRVIPLPTLSDAQKDWLTRGGSLTAHLRALGSVTVEVTREAVDIPWQDEARALGVTPRTPVWVREVVLKVDAV